MTPAERARLDADMIEALASELVDAEHQRDGYAVWFRAALARLAELTRENDRLREQLRELRHAQREQPQSDEHHQEAA